MCAILGDAGIFRIPASEQLHEVPGSILDERLALLAQPLLIVNAYAKASLQNEG